MNVPCPDYFRETLFDRGLIGVACDLMQCQYITG